MLAAPLGIEPPQWGFGGAACSGATSNFFSTLVFYRMRAK